MRFDILCAKSTGKGENSKNTAESAESLANMFVEWDNRFSPVGDVTVKDASRVLTVEVVLFSLDCAAGDADDTAFRIKVTSGDVDEVAYIRLGKFRDELIDFVREKAHFSEVRITRDEVSKYIAQMLYPLLYDTENRIRWLIARVYTSKFGTGWFDAQIDKQLSGNAYGTKKDSALVFGGKVAGDIAFTEFSDLAKILCGNDNRFVETGKQATKALDELVERIIKGTDFTSLQEELRNIYGGVFGGFFKDRHFADEWLKLRDIRNKVAHHRCLSLQDKDDAEALCSKISNMVDEYNELHQRDAHAGEDDAAVAKEKGANAKIAMQMIAANASEEDETDEPPVQSTVLPPAPVPYTYAPYAEPQGYSRRIAVVPQPHRAPPYKFITEEELLHELRLVSSGKEYVALTYFVKTVLADMRYDIAYSYAMVNDLTARGVLRLEKRMLDNNPNYPVTCVFFANA